MNQSEKLREMLAQLRNAPLSRFIEPDSYDFGSREQTKTANWMARDIVNGVLDAIEAALAPASEPKSSDDLRGKAYTFKLMNGELAEPAKPPEKGEGEAVGTGDVFIPPLAAAELDPFGEGYEMGRKHMKMEMEGPRAAAEPQRDSHTTNQADHRKPGVSSEPDAQNTHPGPSAALPMER